MVVPEAVVGISPHVAAHQGAIASALRDLYEQELHAVRMGKDGIVVARNPRQRWTSRFDGKGFECVPDHGEWSWGLELRPMTAERFPASPEVVLEKNRIEYRWGPGLREWFVNDAKGLEQGWTVTEKPSTQRGCQELKIELALKGNLIMKPCLDNSVTFCAKDGAAVLTYGGLKAWDASGNPLLTRFLLADERTLTVIVDDRQAAYPVTIDPVAQLTYLKASNAEALDLFSQGALAISGNTVVVGASREASSARTINGNGSNNSAAEAGAAYVFVKTSTGWTQQAYLKASNADQYDLFGWSVAIDGDTVVVGARYEASGASGVNGNQSDNSRGLSGAAYVFVRSGNTWSQQAYLKASNPAAVSLFGDKVCILENTIVVGAINESSAGAGVNGSQTYNSNYGYAGAAYVFVRSGTSWSQQAYLKGSNTFFGYALSMSGETLAIGAYGEDSGTGSQSDNSAGNAGACYIFVRSGTTWSQQAYLKASNIGANDYFAADVSLSGDTLLIGASEEDSSAVGVNGNGLDNSRSNSGAAYVFTWNGTAWTQ